MIRKRKPRLILAVKTLNRISYLRQCLATWSATANTVDFLWKIVVADDGSQDGTLQYLETFGPAPITLIRNRRRYAVGQFNSILAHIEGDDYDVCFMADDDVLFLRGGWEHFYLRGIEESGNHHLCWFDRDYWRLAWPYRPLSATRIDATATCEGSIRVQDCLGAFFTVTPRVFETVGYADEANFAVRGQWHADQHGLGDLAERGAASRQRLQQRHDDRQLAQPHHRRVQVDAHRFTRGMWSRPGRGGSTRACGRA